MYLLSYIRGDFVYCPVLLVLFTTSGGILSIVLFYWFCSFCGAGVMLVLKQKPAGGAYGVCLVCGEMFERFAFASLEKNPCG